ncbi:MFS transporter, partial [Streptomyces boncukensis]
MTDPFAAPPPSARGAAVRERWLLLVVALVQFLVALDMSVVNVALPDIRASLDFSASGLTWVVNAYALTFGGLLMLGGRTGDVAGRRRTLLAGLALFGLASVGGGCAQSAGHLIAARAAQGVGAAVLTPVALALITVRFPAGPARVRALALWGASAAVGGAVGVLAGGVLTQTAGWRAVLFVNVPFVALGLLAAVRGVPADERHAATPRLDIAGALLATAGTSTLVLGVVRTEQHAWGSATTLLTLALAAALLAGFALVERRTADPLLRLGLLRRRPVIAANLIVLLLFSGQFAAFYFVSLYLQQVLGYGPAATGLSFLPFTAGIVAGSAFATRTAERLGPRALLTCGGAVAAIGFGWFGAVLGADGSFTVSVLGPSVVTSLGLGVCFIPVATAATTGVGPEEAGMASGLVTSSRQIGGSLGLAALSTVAATVTERRGGVSGDADGGGADRLSALASGYATAVGISGALLAAAALLAYVLLPRPSRPSGGSATGASPRRTGKDRGEGALSVR